jgi:hypothetical protein
MQKAKSLPAGNAGPRSFEPCVQASSMAREPIDPTDLAKMRANGVRSLAIQCHQCLHDVVLNVDHLPPAALPSARLATIS